MLLSIPFHFEQFDVDVVDVDVEESPVAFLTFDGAETDCLGHFIAL